MGKIRQWLTGLGLPAEQDGFRPALILALSLGGLLVAIALTGVAGLATNRNVRDITQRALDIDVNLEDEADDMRAAILDMRHFHRDLVFDGPNQSGTLQNLNTAYMELQEQLDDYAEIDLEPIPDIATAAELRAMADTYWQDFQGAISLYESDPAGFEAASDKGLTRLNEMERAAEALDRLGERRAEASLANVDEANDDARNILLGVLGGLVLIGAALVWVTIRVIAQFRQLYDSQQAASVQLSLALQAKSDFIADASHELRTPLTVLRGNAEAGLAIDRNSAQREILEDIVSEAGRMTKLVEDLLFLARSDADSVPLDIESVPAEPLLLELSERARTLARGAGASFTTRLDGYGTLDVDSARIDQAVMILVDNAAKYSPPGGTVYLASSSWRNEFIIEVADQGPGIKPEDIPFVFERFRRVDKVRNRQRGGTGLGLAIAKTIVEAHEGRIDVHSRDGEGTQMRIYLPLAATSNARKRRVIVAKPLQLAP
ncbi:MAG: HAMP domain-containing histidine kinase [Chloroflexota bacterium]|nr:HAMP domain-containing histidine kinase [Chloroflexota bacterium]